MSACFAVEQHGHVAELTLLSRTMTSAFFAELPTVVAELDADADVRAIVLTGSDRQFSYGLDLRDMGDLLLPLTDGPDAVARHAFLSRLRDLQAALSAVAGCRTPIVATVSGHCIGGGLDLIACADVRVASSDAVFSLRETQMAIVADLGSLQRLVGVIGDGHLREMALTGGDVTAGEAARIGLVNHVEDSRVAALARAHEIAERIASNSPITVRGVKDVLDDERTDRVARGLRYVAAWNSAFLPTRDLGEAISAFAERRRPTFHGD